MIVRHINLVAYVRKQSLELSASQLPLNGGLRGLNLGVQKRHKRTGREIYNL